jgi:hypothetical protein
VQEASDDRAADAAGRPHKTGKPKDADKTPTATVAQPATYAPGETLNTFA